MNALNTLVPSRTSDRDETAADSGATETVAPDTGATETGTAQTSGTAQTTTAGADDATRAGTGAGAEQPLATRTVRGREADGMAVASFVMGLAGLLVFNLVLGPCALVLAGLALKRGTTRRTRAVLGLTLGAADIAVLAAVAAADQSFSWSITG
ncbi:hypothetical protein [Streptomyces nanshensis]|uniref:hypothetical protein n=1 Tax=Streptomyces nanshensis TaxID=518642 RepID=UPI000A7BAF01